VTTVASGSVIIRQLENARVLAGKQNVPYCVAKERGPMADQDLSQLKIDRSVKDVRPRHRKRIVYGALVVVLIGVFFYLYSTGMFTSGIPVEVAVVSEVYPSQALTVLDASGYVVAQRKAAVASKVTGRLVELTVEEGSSVREGQVIARLENDDAVAARDQARQSLKATQAGLDAAKAELKNATLEFERNQRLLATQSIARSLYDSAENRYRSAVAGVAGAEAEVKAAEAALRGAEVAVDYTLIRAPFEAVVLTKNADVGDIVTPIGAAADARASVVTIADMSTLQVETDVSEQNLGLVKLEQPCEIRLDALPDTRFRGEVHAIVPTVDRSKATIMVKVRFLDKDPRILPEMSAKVSFLSRALELDEKRPRPSVMRSAVVQGNEGTTVFIIKGNRTVQTRIKMGARFGDVVEIVEGVNVGDRVVIKPPKSLKGGSRIKLTE